MVTVKYQHFISQSFTKSFKTGRPKVPADLLDLRIKQKKYLHITGFVNKFDKMSFINPEAKIEIWKNS